MGRPDFFIVGAPKCGTSALYVYLRQHPEVFMPSCKEPHYFSSDIVERTYVTQPAEYYALFDGSESARRVGEASIWYLYSKIAARRIKSEIGDPGIIIMLRNPVDMIHAFHAQALITGHENLSEFGSALEAEASRRRGEAWPRGRSDPKLLYSEIAAFATQVERYMEVFGSHSVHVILHEDLVATPGRVYRSCLEFLGVEPDHVPEFEVVNPPKRVRSLTIQRMLRQPSSIVRRLVRWTAPRSVRRMAAGRIESWNLIAASRSPMDPELRSRLTRAFAPDVARLADLIGRDLSTWSSLDAPPDTR